MASSRVRRALDTHAISRRQLLATAVTTTLLGACAAVLPRSVGFTAKEIEERLARRMPLKRSVAGLLELELTNPGIALLANSGRLGATFDVSLRIPLVLRDLSGKIAFSGVPRLDAAGRAIFLDQASVERLAIDGLPGALSSRLTEIAARIAEDQFARRPLYTLEEDQTRFAGVALNPTGLRIEHDRLVVDVAPR